jgi:hypothetical protein
MTPSKQLEDFAISSAVVVSLAGLADPPVTNGCLDSDPRWQAVHRILSSESFAKSARLSSFLSYVAERTLLGREDEVTEQQIGVHVFGRPSDYNPGEDNIVRQTARQLRQRLALYYQEEGQDERLHILIPRGGYTTQFHAPASAQVASEPKDSLPAVDDGISSQVDRALGESLELNTSSETETLQHTSRPRANLFRIRWLNLCVGMLLGGMLMAAGYMLWQRQFNPPSASDALWKTLFHRDKKTIIVLGDAGLNMYSNVARREVGIEDYAQQDYQHTPEAAVPAGDTWAPFAARRYIAYSDLTFVTQLLASAQTDVKQLDLRFARDIHISDLESGNAILVGGPNYNPWVRAFDKRIDLQMKYDGERNTLVVTNRAPAAGESASYTWSQSDPSRTGYALICLTDNIQSTGKVLLVEGTTMGGVQTATDFLFNPASINPIIQRARTEKGGISNFDLLLETTFYPGGTLQAKVVVLHIHSQDQGKSLQAQR